MMPPKAKGLGKGLDTLIPSAKKETATRTSHSPKEEEAKDAQVFVDIMKIEPNKEQPRKSFEEDSLSELSDSIKQFGILQPLLVCDRGTHYEIIAGERRFRAARMAGLTQVPVIIGKFTDLEIVEISLIENIQRENLNPVEEALAYKRLLEEFHLKQDDIAERVSKSRATVTNSLRLLKLCDTVQDMLIQDLITTGHARALIGIDEDAQIELANRIIDEKLNVRDIEKIVKNRDKPKKKKTILTEKSLEIVYEAMANQLRETFGSKVQIIPQGNGTGKIEISFYSHDEAERIFEVMKGNRV